MTAKNRLASRAMGAVSAFCDHTTAGTTVHRMNEIMAAIVYFAEVFMMFFFRFCCLWSARLFMCIIYEIRRDKGAGGFGLPKTLYQMPYNYILS